MKHWHQSLTIWFGTALTTVGTVAEYVSQNGDTLRPFLGQHGGAILTGVGIATILLRRRTTTAIQ